MSEFRYIFNAQPSSLSAGALKPSTKLWFCSNGTVFAHTIAKINSLVHFARPTNLWNNPIEIEKTYPRTLAWRWF